MNKTGPALDIAQLKGLSEEEAQRRLRAIGRNELPAARRHSFWKLAFGVLGEPMTLLLLASGGIYLLLGDRQDALILLSFVAVLLALTLFQQEKAERSLDALRNLTSPRASVIRDGKQRRIPGGEVVPGDLVILSEGDRVAADGVLIDAISLMIDESLLSGESVSVRKSVRGNQGGETESEAFSPGGDDLPFVFSGTLVVRGQGIFEVKATGVQTEIGRIGKQLQSVTGEKTFLQRETRKLVIGFSLTALCLCLILIIVYGLTRGHWLEAILAGLTFTMAMIPEEFPVILMVFMALGAWRLAKQHVLTRRIPAIETLGAATVLCVDKTGTLTQNRMRVQQIAARNQCFEPAANNAALPEVFHEIIEFSILASQRDPFDPMEIAFRELGEHYLANTEHLHANWELVQEYPLTQELLAMSRVWRPVGPPENGQREAEREEYVIAAKGAPEAILDLCHVEPAVFESQMSIVQRMAAEGLRVLGVARADFTPQPSPPLLPEIQHDFVFQFLGFVGLSDPIREDAAEAVRQCHTAGIRIVMITGDYPQTAQSIARQVGFPNADRVVSGAELAAMTDDALQETIRSVSIFARVVPEQKLRLINALKANGEIVAMAGDGVNDAPALKAAHIGLAMGARGTDVAREAAAMVLTTDDFSAMVQAVEMGRRIFDNLRKAISYILAIHIPIAGMSLLPVLFHWPLILMPVHVAFLQLIIDPACSVVFEAEEPEAGIMRRPPRKSDEPLLNGRIWGTCALQGVSILAMVMGVYAWALQTNHTQGGSRAMAFIVLIFSNLALIVANRSWSQGFLALLARPNRALRWVLPLALLFLAGAILNPAAQKLFHFGRLQGRDIVLCLSAGLLSILWLDLLKRMAARPE